MRFKEDSRTFFCARTFPLALILFPELLQAQDALKAHWAMKPALVRIETFGETLGGEPIESFGTGVILTPSGDILTAFHVLAPLENSDPSKIEIFVRIGEAAANQREASSIFSIEALDLALLLIDDPPENLTYACRATSGERPDSLPLVLTSGFENDGTYVRRQAEIIGNGQRGTIIVDMPAAEAQSGSPIYTASGEVVGILKGIREGRAGESLFIPLNNVLGQLPALPEICPTRSSDTTADAPVSEAARWWMQENFGNSRWDGRPDWGEISFDASGMRATYTNAPGRATGAIQLQTIDDDASGYVRYFGEWRQSDGKRGDMYIIISLYGESAQINWGPEFEIVSPLAKLDWN